MIKNLFHPKYNRNNTLFRYFFSYLLILIALFICFFFVVRVQMQRVYSHEMYTQVERRMESIRDYLSSNITSLNQTDNLMRRDINMILTQYSGENYYLYEAYKKMTDYTVTNSFLDTICYVDMKRDRILSSGNHMRKTADGYEIYGNNAYVSFSLMDYLESNTSRLVFLNQGDERLLLYLPYNEHNSSYCLIYIISLTELESFMADNQGMGMLSIALLTGENEIAAGMSRDELIPYLPKVTGQSGFYSEEDKSTLYGTAGLISNYSLLALLSDEPIVIQVNIALRNCLLILLLLAGFGLVLIFPAMRLTYWPLHKLTKRLVPSPSPHQSYTEQLSNAFMDVYSENRVLLEKIDSYRLSMQKSLLDVVVTENAADGPVGKVNIDQLFCMDPGSVLFMVKVKPSIAIKDFPLGTLSFFNDCLPGESPCSIFESTKHYAVFLICYSGPEDHKEEAMEQLLWDLNEMSCCYCALSNSAESPLGIPSLYENVMHAAEYWHQSPVISYAQIADEISASNNLEYPYAQLEQFSLLLGRQDFQLAGEQLRRLFTLLDNTADAHAKLPDFFIRCILIDILTALANSMNRMNIRFKSYNELYFTTLYLCRSCPYDQKRDEIVDNMFQLLETYESEYANSAIHTNQIAEILQSSYASPDFSIATLADTFHVSIAYMSYLFKKKFNENFSDYLWKLRLEKAGELLRASDMSIDQISISVGYLNTSSFRRKFKQETGLTPSQYREQK